METVDIDFKNLILRVDEDRGVVYIDDKRIGETIIRIGGLERQGKSQAPTFSNCDIFITETGLLMNGYSSFKERREMSHLKNYLVFTGTEYESLGGWGDFKESFDNREEAKKFAEKLVKDEGDDWGQVIFIGDDIGEELVTEYYSLENFKEQETRKGEWHESTD